MADDNDNREPVDRTTIVETNGGGSGGVLAIVLLIIVILVLFILLDRESGELVYVNAVTILRLSGAAPRRGFSSRPARPSGGSTKRRTTPAGSRCRRMAGC